MKPTTSLGQLLRCHRKKAELTQAALAARLGYDHSLLSRIEKGKRLPTREYLESLITTLQLPQAEGQQIWILYLQTISHAAGSGITLPPTSSPLPGATLQFQPPDQLTWPQWRELCADVGQLRMATSQHKYCPELYFPRDPIHQALEKFLESEQRCFVLVGKSGVGKSNFLMASAQELQQSRDDVCVLMYDGAYLPVKPAISEVITQDIAERFMLIDAGQTQDIWTALARITESESRLVVLYVDALNECPQPQELLWQLDHLARRPWPWLKIVFTSRPETWAEIKRGVSLAETLYYQEEGSEPLGIKLEPFSSEELPLVYARYQQIFRLQTGYENLSPEVREFIRDPLSLLLVAGIYEGQTIPDNLKMTALVEQYVQALLRSNRLQAEDVSWLENELMPLMVREQYCNNTVTMIYLEPAGKGAYLNQSLTNLLNVDILTRQGKGVDQKIVFKYERFYDYFAGKRIWGLAGAASNRAEVYLHLLDYLPRHLYLWGAIQTALEIELQQGNVEIVEYLAGQKLPLLEEILAGTLIAFEQENRHAVEKIIHTLGHNPQAQVRKTALAVAGSLEYQDVLIQAGDDLDTSVRLAAVYAAYLLWQRQPIIGWTILETWADKVGLSWKFSWPPVTVAGFEVSLLLSILMITAPRQTVEQAQAIQQSLQRVWRGILSKLLFIDKTKKDNFIRKLVRLVAQKLMEKHFQQWAEKGQMGQILAEFFPLPETRKKTFLKLLHCFELSYEELLSEEELLVEVLLWNEHLIDYIIVTILVSKLPHEGDYGLEFVNRLFKKTLRIERPLHCSGCLVTCVYAIVSRKWRPISDEAFAIYRHMVKEHFDKTRGLYYNNNGSMGMHLGMELFSSVEWAKRLTSRPEMSIYAFEQIISSEHPHKQFIIEGLLQDTLQLSILVGHPDLALEAAKVVLKHSELWQHASPIRDKLAYCLAVAKRHAPQVLDDIFETYKIPQAMRHLVQAKEMTEISWTRTLFPKITILIINAISHPRVRGGIVRSFKALPDCANREQWLKIVLKEMVNLVYGEQVI